MNELDDLYQSVVLDHGRRPRNFGKLAEPSHHAEGFNPLCGDQLTLYLTIEGGQVADVRFEGSGCAISMASASLMTEQLKGKSADEIEALFGLFHDAVTGQPADKALGKLRALAGVSRFPMRVKCATLAWHTLRAALEGREAPVNTEADE